MKVRYGSGAPFMEFTGLGVIATNQWVEISKKAADAFKEAQGKTLEQAGFEVQQSSKKEED